MRVYLDTSVFGGCFDDEFRRDSDHVMQALRCADMIALVSDVTISELAHAPEQVLELLASLL